MYLLAKHYLLAPLLDQAIKKYSLAANMSPHSILTLKKWSSALIKKGYFNYLYEGESSPPSSFAAVCENFNSAFSLCKSYFPSLSLPEFFASSFSIGSIPSPDISMYSSPVHSEAIQPQSHKYEFDVGPLIVDLNEPRIPVKHIETIDNRVVFELLIEWSQALRRYAQILENVNLSAKNRESALRIYQYSIVLLFKALLVFVRLFFFPFETPNF